MASQAQQKTDDKKKENNQGIANTLTANDIERANKMKEFAAAKSNSNSKEDNFINRALTALMNDPRYKTASAKEKQELIKKRQQMALARIAQTKVKSSPNVYIDKETNKMFLVKGTSLVEVHNLAATVKKAVNNNMNTAAMLKAMPALTSKMQQIRNIQDEKSKIERNMAARKLDIDKRKIELADMENKLHSMNVLQNKFISTSATAGANLNKDMAALSLVLNKTTMMNSKMLTGAEMSIYKLNKSAEERLRELEKANSDAISDAIRRKEIADYNRELLEIARQRLINQQDRTANTVRDAAQAVNRMEAEKGLADQHLDALRAAGIKISKTISDAHNKILSDILDARNAANGTANKDIRNATKDLQEAEAERKKKADEAAQRLADLERQAKELQDKLAADKAAAAARAAADKIARDQLEAARRAAEAAAAAARKAAEEAAEKARNAAKNAPTDPGRTRPPPPPPPPGPIGTPPGPGPTPPGPTGGTGTIAPPVTKEILDRCGGSCLGGGEWIFTTGKQSPYYFCKYGVHWVSQEQLNKCISSGDPIRETNQGVDDDKYANPRDEKAWKKRDIDEFIHAYNNDFIRAVVTTYGPTYGNERLTYTYNAAQGYWKINRVYVI